MLTPDQIEALKQHALDGDGDACLQLARIFDRGGQHDVALMWLKEAVGTGHTGSMTALGARLLVGRAAPQDMGTGAVLIAEAANRGHAEACAMAAMLAVGGVGRSRDLVEAGDLLVKAAALGEGRAREQLSLLVSDPVLSAHLRHGAESEITWSHLRAQIDLAAFIRAPAPEQLNPAPRIFAIRQLLSPVLCKALIERASPKLEAARIQDAEKGGARADGMRTNTGMGFSLLETDALMQLIRLKIAAAVGVPAERLEATNVLHYAPGESYAPHVDYLDPTAPGLAGRLRQLGQRAATCLIYLNTDYEGGETAFIDLSWRFKGGLGDGLIFFNVGADGRPDPRTLHAGLAPTSGEKWLLSQWIRDRPQHVA